MAIQDINSPVADSVSAFVPVTDSLRAHAQGRVNASQTYTGQCLIRVLYPCSEMRILFSNYRRDPAGSPVESSTGNSLTVRASIATDAAGTNLTPLFTTTNLRDAVIQDGDSVWMTVKGPFLPGNYYVRYNTDSGGASNWTPTNKALQGTLSGFNNVAEGWQSGSGLADGGAYTAMGGVVGYAPTAVVGVVRAGFEKTGVLLVGDSIMTESADLAEIAPIYNLPVSKQGGGFGVRACQIRGLAHIKVSMGGDQAAFFSTRAGSYRRYAAISEVSGLNVAISNYGINDLGSSLAVMQANSLALWAQLKILCPRVYACTLAPRDITTTNDYMTVAAQTNTNVSANTRRQEFNAWLRDAGPTGAVAQSLGNLTAVIDTAATVEQNTGTIAAPVYTNFWKESEIADTGVAGGTLTTTRTDDPVKNWPAGSWFEGELIEFTSGPNNGLVRIITGTPSAGRINHVAFPVAANPGDTFRIRSRYSFDGIHPVGWGHRQMANAVLASGAF